MDKGFTLKVIEVGAIVTLNAGTANYKYRGIKEPNHTCKQPNALKSGDVVIVQNETPKKDVLIMGPCGCNFLLYELVAEA
jgi:hypothetical protein